jgi:predicted nuclease with RNAse H fold
LPQFAIARSRSIALLIEACSPRRGISSSVERTAAEYFTNPCQLGGGQHQRLSNDTCRQQGFQVRPPTGSAIRSASRRAVLVARMVNERLDVRVDGYVPD